MTDPGVLPSPEKVMALVSGTWVDGVARPIHSPYDGRVVAMLHENSPEQVRQAVDSAAAEWTDWRAVPAYKRSAALAKLAELMAARSEDLAVSISRGTGKILRDSRSEVSRAISTITISAEEAKRISGEVIPMDALAAGSGKLGFAVRESLGVIAGITPFNAPLGTLCHKLGPALAAGNTFVLKPHPQGSGVATLLGQLALDAGLPPGAFNVVHGEVEVGRALTTHSSVALVNFTGSGKVAEQIVKEIGLKRTVLELGGTAPTIVHGDADLVRAVVECVGAAFALNGQSCVSTQRIYVQDVIYERFLTALVESVGRLRAGDPFDESSGIGPVIDSGTADRIERWIAEAVAGGARVACGGQREGTLIQPTVITDTSPSMRVVCEEVFGPVVSVIPYVDLEDAISAANASPWGLKSGIFTSSLDVAIRAARALEFGTVNVNGPSRSRVDHEPSGGAKLSGWGTEGPRYAIADMTRLKMISVGTDR